VPTAEELLQEAAALRAGGDPATAKRFIAVANAMQKPEKMRSQYSERYGAPALAAMLGHDIEPDDPEGRDIFDDAEEQRRLLRVDRDDDMDPETRSRLFSLLGRAVRGGQRADTAEEEGQAMLGDLQASDPSKYFLDRDMKDWDEWTAQNAADNPFNEGTAQTWEEGQELLNRRKNMSPWELVAHDEQQMMDTGRNPNRSTDEIIQVGKGKPMDLAWRVLKQMPPSCAACRKPLTNEDPLFRYIDKLRPHEILCSQCMGPRDEESDWRV